jgi:hypothetical protein
MLGSLCLEPRREDRRPDPSAVAEAVVAWMESVQQTLRHAEGERAAAQA